MYRPYSPNKTTLHVNTSYEGETIEQKIQRVTNNKEPISDGAPLIYTERIKGVEPEYDIRTDRFEVAIDAMDKISKSHKAKREERHKPKDIGEEAKDGMKKEKDGETKPKDGEAKPIQGT